MNPESPRPPAGGPPGHFTRLVHGVVATDAVVIGAGVAGVSAALGLCDRDVTIMSKSSLGGGSSRWAQGGVAVALPAADSPELHADDTLAVGAGLNDPDAVDILTAEGPARIKDLIGLGTEFDRTEDGELIYGREAGHSLFRILHANGDQTGAELMRSLTSAVRSQPSIRVVEQTFAVDLVVADGRVVGVLALDEHERRVLYLTAAVVLATGGVGQLYARTTNPVEVTGDGHAMAARAGARLIDMEFVQFHPTGLAGSLDPMPLLTEAIRGEGGILVNELGERFMVDVHPDAELAPRDVVARANWSQLQAGHTVYLDATESHGADFPRRFPTVFAASRQAGVDPRVEGIPASPGAHYHMGGVETDLDGRTSLPGLWAAGEVSCTGVHGANRLASNSLLEGLVFGARVARSVVDAGGVVPPLNVALSHLPKVAEPSPDESALIAQLREVMWKHVGLVRNGEELQAALDRIAAMRPEVEGRAGVARNMVETAWHIVTAALARTESRGAHFRSDHPEPGSAVRHAFQNRQIDIVPSDAMATVG